MASGTIKAVVGRSDIVNNLTTNDSTKVLSAAQGYALNSNLGKISTPNVLNGKTAIENFIIDACAGTKSNSFAFILNSSKNDVITSAFNTTNGFLQIMEANDLWGNHPFFIFTSGNIFGSGIITNSNGVLSIGSVSNIVDFQTHNGYVSTASTWDSAIEEWVDSLPATQKMNMGFIQRAGQGVRMAIAQKMADSNYAAAIGFGYWTANVTYYRKVDGTWTAEPLALNSSITKTTAGASTYGSVSIKKATAGNIVVITGSFGASSNVSANTVFLTGLPTVDGPNFTPITAFDNTGATPVTWVLKNDGSIQNVDAIIKDHSYRFSFSYAN